MHKVRAAISTAVAAGLAVIGIAGPASAAAPATTRTINVIADTLGGLHFSATTFPAGNIQFYVSSHLTNGAAVTLVKLKPGVSFPEFSAVLREEFSQNPATRAKGTRDVVKLAAIYGLADVVKGSPAAVIERLAAGTYYAFNTDTNSPPTAKTATVLHITATTSMAAPMVTPALPTVSMTSDDRFVVTGALKAHGGITVRNTSDTIHFMALSPVKPGTTDAQIQAYFSSGAQTPPPFALNGPSTGTDVLSPGVSLVFSYWVPKGTYVLLCFIADSVTGMPHAVMGMHKVVTLT